MKIIGGSKLVIFAMLTGLLVAAPVALVRADNLNPEAADSAAVSDSADANQVLEIPQQCDPDSVGDPCDGAAAANSSDDGSSSADAAASNAGNDPTSGSLDDYLNRGADDEASLGGPIYVPAPMWIPAYAYYSPAPVIVSPRPIGPGFYQTWTSGPGTYPTPMFGGGGFGPRPFGGGGFRHR